ncbi:hypothetical protein E2C01_081040 [Portunus trituberculatus]|uniref:Uncharacterized protein n=1 Tax=Portunus trituberculatus TaxID=210409 RepID=A0A5B7INS8_PORTR|nr:hypothetical protein [Portunus trituberculatus]
MSLLIFPARDDVKHRFSRRCQPAINTILQKFWGRAFFCDLLLAFVADVNLVAEPKPHQIGRKRPNVAKTSGDW